MRFHCFLFHSEFQMGSKIYYTALGYIGISLEMVHYIGTKWFSEVVKKPTKDGKIEVLR